MTITRVVASCFVTLSLCLSASAADWTVTPMRPLPTASDRPIDPASPSYFVDAQHGDDAAAGTKDAPFKSIARGLQQLKPGDTLILRGGTYYEAPTCTISGEQGKPITIRSFPGEVGIIDAGLREFIDSPQTAWEPVEGGAAGEFQSSKAYPELAGDVERGVGNFADSMVPLHPYRTLIDLQADNQYWIFKEKTGAAEGGLYCGPGIWLDNEGSHRLHIRLAHLSLAGLHDRNYTSETDPRMVRLIVCGAEHTLALTGCKHVRLQDLVLRGAKGVTLDLADASDIEIDGITAFSGRAAMQLVRSADVRVTNSAFRGLAAPWSYRNHQKYRGVDSYIINTGRYETPATNERIEFRNCEFTDHHDALRIDGCKTVTVKQCLMDNFNDDGIDLGAKAKTQRFQIEQNVLSRTFQVITVHRDEKSAGPLVEGDPGSGAYITRNIIDLRGPVLARLPSGADQPQDLNNYGRPLIDHGSPTWVNLYIYQNTVFLKGPVFRDMYAGGMTMGLRGTQRRILNNIFVHTLDMPGATVMLPPDGADFVGDYNLHWSLPKGPSYPGDYLADSRKVKNPKLEWFEASKTSYVDGWTAHDQFSDPKFVAMPADWTQPTDLALQAGSPAIGKGGPIPAEWPDPLRKPGQAAPDLGAVPVDSKPWTFGINGRYSVDKLDEFKAVR